MIKYLAPLLLLLFLAPAPPQTMPACTAAQHDRYTAPVLADVWRYILTSGNLLPGDVLTSAADSRYAFGVTDTEPWYEYVRGDLERRR